MNKSSNLRTGGRILVDQLRIHGVEFAFAYPSANLPLDLDRWASRCL